jgi:hypothetical protein
MSLNVDFFTFSAIGVVFFVILALAWGASRARKTDRAHIDELRGRLDRVSHSTLIPSEAARELCLSIRCLYPAMQMGVDFRVADDGEGAYIEEWNNAAAKPSQEQLDQGMAECRRNKDVSRYREERAFAYPSVSDQLDAMYKARMGDASDLEVIDQQIAEVKERYPRGDSC